MKGYWLILGGEVTDSEAQAEYGRLWAPIAAQYQARVIRGDQGAELKEGRQTARVLLVEFPSLEMARACYADPAYAEAAAWAHKASTRDLVVLQGDIAPLN